MEEILDKLKEKHRLSQSRQMALTGGRYYRSNNDIMKRRMYFYADGQIINDPYRANNRIASAYYKALVDQKINFILGNYPAVEVLNDDFWYKLKDIATNASIKGIQWVQPYILDGEFVIEQIPTEELMPIFKNDELVKMYRFYKVDGVEYTKEYTSTEEITYIGDDVQERKGHLIERVIEGTIERTTNKSWGVVPFIPLYNNMTATYDLEPVKSHIDAYDIVMSDFINNLEDFQDVTWILRGYDGSNVADFINEVKMYKTLVVGDGGEARAETIEIPHEARAKALDLLEGLIYKFGFGLNMENLGGSSLTNVNIQAQFANLEMKCNAFSQEVSKFIDRYIEFYNIYASMTGKEQIEPQEVEYNKTTMVNRLEEEEAKATELESNAKQLGAISEYTRLLNSPYNTGATLEEKEQWAKEEIQRIEEEATLRLDNDIPETEV